MDSPPSVTPTSSLSLVDERSVTLAVLAGGAGSRMGRAKAGLRVEGRAILAYLLDRLAWAGPTLLVTAPGRERPAGGERFGREIVDPVAGLGPLRGVLTALEAVETPRLVIATVDMPGVTSDVLRFLLRSLRPPVLGAMCTRASDGGPQVEPFPVALSGDALEVVREQFAGGRRSVWSLTSVPRFVAVPAEPTWPPIVWTNLNRPADVDAFAAAAGVRVEGV